ncbi:HAMP domain-containing histidine kinase [Irregularibacter muris]|uniref:histidine kinase n=1 Tax=Irregularibacter muris TaxID=1796619 RepID=A0AAE3KZB8_9FIRM|nr:HAMP domain-containing sensor histidine kinase [Irregularibacter muris]MCR1898486.1 HAMP domain-containing histidine kinase [Irregularibacter muris]
MNVVLFILIKLNDIRQDKMINKKIHSVFELLNTLDADTDNYEVIDDEFGRLRDEIVKTVIEKRQVAAEATKNRDTLKTYVEDIAHQIKTPLTGILLMLDLINEEPTNVDEYARYIRNDVNRLYQLTDILLKMASLDSGLVPMRNEVFSVKELLIEIKTSLESFFAKDNLPVVIKGDDFTLFRDEQWVYEAVFNIIKNGLEASEEKGIEIELKTSNIHQSILVRDYSEGISDKMLQKYYTRFYKSNPKTKGFGIGLPMAKSIMEKQNGDLLYFREKNSNYFELRFYK